MQEQRGPPYSKVTMTLRYLCCVIGLSLSAVVLLAGCGSRRHADYSGLELVEVRGTVTLDGKPLRGAQVVFEAADRTYSCGRTDAAGRYQLAFNSEKSGVPPGVKIVRIRTLGAGDEDESAAPEGNDGSAASSGEMLPACYNSKSQLQVTVEGRSQTFNFDLKSDRSTQSAS